MFPVSTVALPHPEGSADQLLLNARMYVEQQQLEHQGIAKVNVLNAKADTAHHVADVFLQQPSAATAPEQIVVQMVEVKGEWRER